LILWIALLSLLSSAQAASITHAFSADSVALYRNLSGSSLDHSWDGFFVGNFRLQGNGEEWSWEIAPELRALASPGVAAGAGDPARISVKAPRRFLDTEIELHHENGSESYLDLDRLGFSYRAESWEAFAGRRPLSLGVLRFLPVWNKFSRPLPLAVGIPLVYSSDQLSLRWQREAASAQLLGLFGERAISDGLQIGTATWYSGGNELHALAGRWYEHPVAGLAFAGDFLDATFRLEAIHWWRRSGFAQDPEAQTQIGAGAEYAFSESLSGVAEFLYLSKKGSLFSSDRLNPGLRSRWYGTALFQYQLSAFWQLGAGAFKNLADPSQFWLLRLKRSLSDHTDLAFAANLASGKEGSEFSRRSYTLPTGGFLGATSSAQLELSFTL
jgi:hypothetical protein